jgi:hypothetical protein
MILMMVVPKPAGARRPYGRSGSALITDSETLNRCEGVFGRLFFAPLSLPHYLCPTIFSWLDDVVFRG